MLTWFTLAAAAGFVLFRSLSFRAARHRDQTLQEIDTEFIHELNGGERRDG